MANPFSKFIGPDKTEYEVKDEAARQAIEGIKTPEFDDSGTVEGITSFPAFLEKYVSKMNMLQFLRDMRAGFNFVLHGGHIINNCVTDRADLPGSAAQLKALMDLYNQLNGSLSDSLIHRSVFSGDFNATNIPHGIYTIHSLGTFTNGPDTSYGVFIQFADEFYTQLVIGTYPSYNLFYRTYTGSPVQWNDWQQTATKAELDALAVRVTALENK